MTLSKDEAAHALAEIDDAGRRLREVTAYHYAWPYFVYWGLAWLIADLGSQWSPEPYQGWVWPVTSLVFTVLSIAQGFSSQSRSPYRGRRSLGWRPMASAGVVMLFAATLMVVLQPLDPKRVHSFFGLFFGFAYILQGLWLGWRLVALGALLAGLTVIAFYALPLMGGYLVMMGLAGGGGLILGGLWLRTL